MLRFIVASTLAGLFCLQAERTVESIEEKNVRNQAFTVERVTEKQFHAMHFGQSADQAQRRLHRLFTREVARLEELRRKHQRNNSAEGATKQASYAIPRSPSSLLNVDVANGGAARRIQTRRGTLYRVWRGTPRDWHWHLRWLFVNETDNSVQLRDSDKGGTLIDEWELGCLSSTFIGEEPEATKKIAEKFGIGTNSCLRLAGVFKVFDKKPQSIRRLSDDKEVQWVCFLNASTSSTKDFTTAEAVAALDELSAARANIVGRIGMPYPCTGDNNDQIVNKMMRSDEAMQSLKNELGNMMPILGGAVCVDFRFMLSPGVFLNVALAVDVSWNSGNRCWSWKGRFSVHISFGFRVFGIPLAVSIGLDGLVGIHEVPFKETSLPIRENLHGNFHDERCHSWTPFPSLFAYFDELSKRVGGEGVNGMSAGKQLEKQSQALRKAVEEQLKNYQEILTVDKPPLSRTLIEERVWFDCSMQHPSCGLLVSGGTDHRGYCYGRDAIAMQALKVCKTAASTRCDELKNSLGLDCPKSWTSWLGDGFYGTGSLTARLESSTLQGRIGFGKHVETWPGSDSRFAVHAAPYAMGAAGALEEAFYRFQGRLPALVQQVLKRLSDDAPEGDDVPEADREDDGQLLRITDGRWLARLPARLRDVQQAELDAAREAGQVPELPITDMEMLQSAAEHGGAAKLSRAAELSGHRKEPAFWKELAASLANLFVRAVADVHALWSIYFTGVGLWDGRCEQLAVRSNLWLETHDKGVPSWLVKTNHNTGVQGDNVKEENNVFLHYPWVSGSGDSGERASWMNSGFVPGDWSFGAGPADTSSNFSKQHIWGTVHPQLWCELIRAAALEPNELSHRSLEPAIDILGFLDEPTSDDLEVSDDSATKSRLKSLAAMKEADNLTRVGLDLHVPGACRHSVLEAEVQSVGRLECEHTLLSYAFAAMFPRFFELVRSTRDLLDGRLEEVLQNVRQGNVTGARDHTRQMGGAFQEFLVRLGADGSSKAFGRIAQGQRGASLKSMLRDWHLGFGYEPLGHSLRGWFWSYIASAKKALKNPGARSAQLLEAQEQAIGSRSNDLYARPAVKYDQTVQIVVGVGAATQLCVPPDQAMFVTAKITAEGNSWSKEALRWTECTGVRFKKNTFEYTIDYCTVYDAPSADGDDDAVSQKTANGSYQGVQVYNSRRMTFTVSSLDVSFEKDFHSKVPKTWADFNIQGELLKPEDVSPVLKTPVVAMVTQMVVNAIGQFFPKAWYSTDDPTDWLSEAKRDRVVGLLTALGNGLQHSMAHSATKALDDAKNAAAVQSGHGEKITKNGGGGLLIDWINCLIGEVVVHERLYKIREDGMAKPHYYRSLSKETTFAFLSLLFLDADTGLQMPSTVAATLEFSFMFLMNLTPLSKLFQDWMLRREHRRRVESCKECVHPPNKAFCDLRHISPAFTSKEHDKCHDLDEKDATCTEKFVDSRGVLVQGYWATNEEECERMPFVVAGDNFDSTQAARYRMAARRGASK